MAEPCIVEVALNGVNPAAPRTPAEITAEALACVAAGASIVHNHNDEPMWVDGGAHSAAPYLEAWRPVVARYPNVLVYATQASGGPGIEVAARWGHHEALAVAGLPVMGLVDPGSVSLGGERVYVNTVDDAAYAVARCVALGIPASVSIFDPSFLRVALRLPLPAGSLIKLYFGGPAAPFGLPPTRPALEAYLAMLDGSGLPWSVAVLGGDVVGCGLAALALGRGGHVRVGLEDYVGPPRSNVSLVEEAVALIEASGRGVARVGR